MVVSSGGESPLRDTLSVVLFEVTGESLSPDITCTRSPRVRGKAAKVFDGELSTDLPAFDLMQVNACEAPALGPAANCRERSSLCIVAVWRPRNDPDFGPSLVLGIGLGLSESGSVRKSASIQLAIACGQHVQATSNSAAAPMPPPTHIVATTYFTPRRLPSINACPTTRTPVMP